MTCETPRDCGECDSCTRDSIEYEAKLDQIQVMIESHIARVSKDLFDGVAMKLSDYIDDLAASIVNGLEDNGWLNLDAVDADS